MKQPYIPLFTGDWLKDPALTLCEPATRGIWMDMICAMHELDRLGELRGTFEQLARIARCSTAQLTQALTELQVTRAADIAERNGVVTVSNRRMKREHTNRILVSKRVNKHRDKVSETEKKRVCNADVTIYESENENEIGLSSSSPGIPKGVQEVIDHGKLIECPEEDCVSFWNHFQSQGWVKSNGLQLTDWRARIATWKLDQARSRAYEISRSVKTNSSSLSIATVAQADTVIRACRAKIEECMQYVTDDGPPRKSVKPDCLEMYKSLQARIKQVEEIRLGLKQS